METHEFKVFDFSDVSRNGQIISKDALKGQDGKHIPVKFGSGEDAIVVGDAELNICADGVSVSMSEETYAKLMKKSKEDK